MIDKTYRLKVAAFIILLIVLAPLSALAGPAAQPLITNEQPVLAHCDRISDGELEDIRGRYDRYYFGLDVIVNLGGSGPVFTMTPNPNNTPGTVNTATGISFSDPYVNYRAGVAPQQLYQMVQVTGDGKIVRGVMNLDVKVPRSLVNGRVSSFTLPRPSETGLKF
jgi:hypothetical protein